MLFVLPGLSVTWMALFLYRKNCIGIQFCFNITTNEALSTILETHTHFVKKGDEELWRSILNYDECELY